MIRSSKKISRRIGYILIFALMAASTVSIHAQNATTVSGKKVLPVINTSKYTEFAPTISADGKTMIFESNKDKGWKLYMSNQDDKGNWSEPFPLTAINEKLHFLAGPSLSYDGNTLFFTGFIEEVSTSEDIFYSERLDGKNWSEPKNIGAPINTNGYEGFPSISADGNALYFIRVNEENPIDRKSKENCFKIFVSHKQRDGSWGNPEALPETINKGCERDPKIMADNHTLIFSAVLPDGKGKYDLYQTKKLGEGKWADPVALDFINSPDNDQSPCISAAGDIVFFYSKNDIYSIPIPEEHRQMINVTVQGFVRSEKSNKPIKSDIQVTNTTTGEKFTHSSNPQDGRYSLVLSAGQQYDVAFTSEAHTPAILQYDLREQDKYAEMRKDVLLKTEYQLSITIQDQDLKQNITAWVKLSEQNGQLVVNDSLKKNQFPFKTILDAGKDYTITIAAPGYTEITTPWKFDGSKMKSELSHVFELQHEKIQFATDVVNIVSNQKVKTKVYFNNENGKEVIIAEAGETVQLRKGDRYQVVTSSDKGYMFTSATIVAGKGQLSENGKLSTGSELSEGGEQKLTLKVGPIEIGAHLTLDHITFASNSADLDSTSFVTLARVTELLQNNVNVSVEISAHTDDIGDDVYNQRLSERRALSIVRYLSKKGIAIARLRPIGYGEKRPLFPNDSDDHRGLNRRVELRVLRAK
jgi:outer membrane protein OmpA-like peptidoglycan-associated protein